jgi:hypothetical protein
MSNYKAVKWCVGIALSVGLTACNTWDMQRSQHVDTHYEPMAQKQKAVVHKVKPVQKTYASKDPTQQATPGPVRKAAPQLPVIQ